MPDTICRVTVQGMGRRVDLVLPATVPIAELMPEVARLCLGEETPGPEAEVAPPVWTLARVGGPPFALTDTLAEHQVVDGEVLHVVDVAVWRTPTVVEVREQVTTALESSSVGGLGAWALAPVAAAHVLAAVALGVRLHAVGIPIGLGALGLAALALGLAVRAGRTAVAVRAALVLEAWGLAGLGGWALAGGPPAAAGVAAAAAGATAAAAATVAVVPAVAPGATMAGLGLFLGGLAVAAGVPSDRVAGLAALLGLAALRLLPAVVAFRLRAGAGDLQGLARRARRLLVSLSAGTAATLLGAALVLASTGGPPGLALTAVTGLGLLLRALSYRFPADALPAALAAGGCLLALEVGVGVQAAARGWVLAAPALPIATGALALLPAVLGRERPEVPPAWWLAVEVPAVLLVLAQWGVWGFLVTLGHRLLG